MRSYVCRLGDLDLERLNGFYQDMEQAGTGIVAEAGVPPEETRAVRTADVRYVGQGHEIRVPVPPGILGPGSVERIQESFDREYGRVYGRVCEGVAAEAVHWRVTVQGPRPDPGGVRTWGERAGGEARKGSRAALFDPEVGAVDVPVFDRYALEPGFELEGPAIVEEAESTTVTFPGWSIAVDEVRSLVLTISGGGG